MGIFDDAVFEGDYPDLIVEMAGPLPEHLGRIVVFGAEVTLVGTRNGSVWLADGAVLSIDGTHNGSLHVDSGCEARVAGVHNG